MPAPRKQAAPIHVARVGVVRVPVYRYGDGRFCVVSRRGGKMHRQTFVSRKAALIKADETALAIANGQAEILELSAAHRDDYLLASNLVAPFGVPIHVALEEWAFARKELGATSIRDAVHYYKNGKASSSLIAPPTAAIVAELLAQIGDQYSAADQVSLKHLNGLRWDLGKFAVAFRDLAASTEEQLRAYLRQLAGHNRQPVGLRRRDNVRDALVRLFRFARSKGYLPEDKTSAAEKILRVSHGADITTFAATELAHFIEHVPHEWRPWMAIAAFAGLRTSEIFRLQWSAVKWESRAIAVPRSVARKVRTARMVPMCDTLLAWLAPWREARGPLYRAEPSWIALERRHQRALAQIKKATGLSWRTNVLRHSFGSHRLAVVKSIDQVALEMGNSPGKVREHYHDPKTDSEATAYFSILPPEARADNILPLPLEFR